MIPTILISHGKTVCTALSEIADWTLRVQDLRLPSQRIKHSTMQAESPVQPVLRVFCCVEADKVTTSQCLRKQGYVNDTTVPAHESCTE